MLQRVEEKIRKAVVEYIKETFEETLSDNQVTINDTKKEFKGDFTVVVFPLLRFTKMSPEASAQAIGNSLIKTVHEIKDFNVIKGFLNLEIDSCYWAQFFSSICEQTNFGFGEDTGKTIMVEYSSPNTNKPLHLGHIRNNVLGYALSGLLEANGNSIIKANLINDRGIHICKSMLAWKKWGNGETPESTGLKGDKLVGKYYVEFDKHYKVEIEALIDKGNTEEEAKKQAPLLLEAQEMLLKWERGDADVRALWQKMNNWVYDGFDTTYKALGVSFDKLYYESDTYLLGKRVIEEGLEEGVFFKKQDGSVWIDLTEEGLDQKLLLRSDGTAVYMTQDMGTADLKFEDYKMDQSVYVVGNEQDYHFKVLKLILEKLGRKHAQGIYHFSYGMVDLPSGKMKSREGTVVDADDLIEEIVDAVKVQTKALGKIDDFNEEEALELFNTIGLTALKFFLLRVDPKKRILFDPKESIDLQGYTGPFVQYTYVRTRSILRRYLKSSQLKPLADNISLNPLEKDLLKLLYHLPTTIRNAGLEMNPSAVVDYTYELAKLYNKYFAEVPILNASEEEANFRVTLSKKIGEVIAQNFRMLGMDVPERM